MKRELSIKIKKKETKWRKRKNYENNVLITGVHYF